MDQKENNKNFIYDVEHLATFSSQIPDKKTSSNNCDSSSTNSSSLQHSPQQSKQQNDNGNDIENDDTNKQQPRTTTPNMALKRLFELEKTSGIWTQRMQIELRDNNLLIIDCETQNVVEQFAKTNVHKPTAFNDHNHIYNNIIIFEIKTTQLNSNGNNQDSPSAGELHIFQCVSHQAQKVVDDILSWQGHQLQSQNDNLNKENHRNQSENKIPIVLTSSSSLKDSKDIPVVNVSVKETVNVFNQIAAQRENKTTTTSTSTSVSQQKTAMSPTFSKVQTTATANSSSSSSSTTSPSATTAPTTTNQQSINGNKVLATQKQLARLSTTSSNGSTNSNSSSSSASASSSSSTTAKATTQFSANSKVPRAILDSHLINSSSSHDHSHHQHHSSSSTNSNTNAAIHQSKHHNHHHHHHHHQQQQHRDHSDHQKHKRRSDPSSGVGGSRGHGADSPPLLPPPPPLSAPTNPIDQATTNEAYVSVLNHCFDDIEKFILRLQTSLNAQRELRREQATGGKSDNLLLIQQRARGPNEDEFFEILAKFKLAFNLLAKLKSCIHEPNAPELVHFIFTPLAIIIDAARNARPVAVDPTMVGVPYLCQDAIDLLSNCCTSKESDIWHSLGPNWTQTIQPQLLLASRLPKSFQPIFGDGWAPVITDLELVGLVMPPTAISTAGVGLPPIGPDGSPLVIVDPLVVPSSSSSSTLAINHGHHGYLGPYNDGDSALGAPGPDQLSDGASSSSDLSPPLGDGTLPLPPPPTSQLSSGPALTNSGPIHRNPINQLRRSQPTIDSNGNGRGMAYGISNDNFVGVGYQPSTGGGGVPPSSSSLSSHSRPRSHHQQPFGGPLNNRHTTGSQLAMPPSSSNTRYPAHHTSYAPPSMANGGSRSTAAAVRALRSPGANDYFGGDPSYHHNYHHDTSMANISNGREMMMSRSKSATIYDPTSTVPDMSTAMPLDRQQAIWLDELVARQAKIVKVLYPRTANNDKELTVFRGEILEVIDDSRKWWKTRNCHNEIAHVPHTIVTEINFDLLTGSSEDNDHHHQQQPHIDQMMSHLNTNDDFSSDRQNHHGRDQQRRIRHHQSQHMNHRHPSNSGVQQHDHISNKGHISSSSSSTSVPHSIQTNSVGSSNWSREKAGAFRYF